MVSDERLHITITYTTPDAKVVTFYERISAHTMIQLAAKLALSLSKLAQIIKDEAVEDERRKHVKDDDGIPF